jgi:hypothetical protein
MTAPTIDHQRIERLGRELRRLLSDMPAERVRELAGESVKDLGRTTSRRVSHTADNLIRLTHGLARETMAAAVAGRDGHFRSHLAGRAHAAIDGARQAAADASQIADRFQSTLRSSPRDALVELFQHSLAALVASGGREGAPDGATRRSRRTALVDGFLPGAVLETMCLSLLRLVNSSHRYLPHGHDRWWDTVQARCLPYRDTLDHGLSVRVAYELFADGLVMPERFAHRRVVVATHELRA